MNQAILQTKRIAIITVAVAVPMLMTLWQAVSTRAQTPPTNAPIDGLYGCIQPSIPYCYGGADIDGSGLGQGATGNISFTASSSQATSTASSKAVQVLGAPKSGAEPPDLSTNAWYLLLGAIGLPMVGLSLRRSFGTR